MLFIPGHYRNGLFISSRVLLQNYLEQRTLETCCNLCYLLLKTFNFKTLDAQAITKVTLNALKLVV